jgi:hypothetical protein
MSAYLLIMAIEAVILLAVWQWDERARRAELQRRRFQLMQANSPADTATRLSPTLSSSAPTAAGQGLG